MDCPTIRVHARNIFKALINSGATISLIHTSIYNMVEDHYKTSILPTVIDLNTADGSPMLSVGKVMLSLCIADFKFSHTFIICNKLPETDFLFAINLQKRYSLCYCRGSDRQLFIQREGSFLTYTRNSEQHQSCQVYTEKATQTQWCNNS